MIAEYESRLRDPGPWSYRSLHWEAGMIGQALYLGAEAIGLRATGIGCYFDDMMHDFLGQRGRDRQDLYHLALGTPVEDSRIQSEKGYSGES